MGEINYEALCDELQAKYGELHREYIHVCEENQKLNEKLERFESGKVYATERNEGLHAKMRHYETMFKEAERNRQMLAAQMDVVHLIFGKKN